MSKKKVCVKTLLGQSKEEQALQRLIDTGQAWSFEGSVGRACMEAIKAGRCVLGLKGHKDYWGNYVPSRNEVEDGSLGSVEYALRLTLKIKVE